MEREGERERLIYFSLCLFVLAAKAERREIEYMNFYKYFYLKEIISRFMHPNANYWYPRQASIIVYIHYMCL